ncbi:primosomal replication protein PriC [Tatumella citrea]|uniref:primosomal replication protein PriC n=1 Tax=Tatumella citrea TaxID=53336 RepID=UPI0012F8C719|nr:primosomal replication protein PriC [Tatumella citrea]
MNKQKVIRQFTALTDHLRRQTEQAGNPVCREKRFDPQLFMDNGNRLQDYLQQVNASLEKLSGISSAESPEFQWLSQRLLDQCQAMQRELNTLDSRRAVLPTVADYWLNKYQEQRGYESRLCEMISQHEQQLNNAETLQQQQLIANKLDLLEQRLARCRAALQESYWQTSVRTPQEN